MADDGWNGLGLLWEAALSRESADADLFDVVISETTSSTLAVTQELKEKQLEIEKEFRRTKVKERAEDRQISFQTITTVLLRLCDRQSSSQSERLL
ncbi:hypothetical protein RvY_15746 [Ramazzottius varieornatus]|uniref:Uncharacterized protein n=1 Tax=Ramazzottius varieornatus TaxID=947166 RepID=A0A1D1VXH5_RAMVA|nr:hypothetical protein RvY_15746 [Ramazzottius varieornatus]